MKNCKKSYKNGKCKFLRNVKMTKMAFIKLNNIETFSNY